MFAQSLPKTSSARFLPVVIAISLLVAVGCGETYDLADRPNAAQGPGVSGPGVTPSSTVDPLDVPVAADADLPTLFAEMLASWRGLDQRVIDANRATDALARIESIWAQTEPVLRRERPTALFGFEQALDLARSAVERRRPADASKGLLIVTNLTRNW
jgi:hypothetical protein